MRLLGALLCTSQLLANAQVAPTPACANGTKSCQYLPGTWQCCSPGEACVAKVGCRCEGNDCDRVIPIAAPTPGVFGMPATTCRLSAEKKGFDNSSSLQPVTFTAVAWNLEGWKQHTQEAQTQATQLLKYKPDFITTQEDMAGWEIQKYLPNFCFMGETRDGHKCPCPKAVGLTATGGSGEHTGIYYDTEKWNVVNTFTEYLGYWDYPRIYTAGKFQHKATGKTVWITSVHFPKKSQIAGQDFCIKEMAYLGKMDAPSILMGDFNIIEEMVASPRYEPFHSNGFSYDSFTNCMSCRACHSGYDKHFATFAPDSIYCDREAPEISDHWPIVATYSF